MLAGVEAGKFQRAFDGFGAAVAEKCFREFFPRRDVGDFLGEVGDRLHVIEIGRAVDEFLHLRFSAATTCGLQWPALATEIPAKQSRYSRPWMSVTVTPLARSITIGATDFKKPVMT